MGWIVDEYSKFYGWSPGVVTGKPIELGGSLGRDAATGRGLLYAAECMFGDLGRKVADFTYAIQGFGNVGSWAAKLIHREGGKIVAVSDVTGALTTSRASTSTRCTLRREAAHAAGLPGADAVPSEALLSDPLRRAHPRRAGGVLTKATAAEVRAKYVIEGANHPSDPEADAVFAKKGILVLPDIYANAGGVTVSYFEWVQNIQQFYWDEERVNTELRNVMRQAFADLKAYAKSPALRLSDRGLCAGDLARRPRHRPARRVTGSPPFDRSAARRITPRAKCARRDFDPDSVVTWRPMRYAR